MTPLRVWLTRQRFPGGLAVSILAVLTVAVVAGAVAERYRGVLAGEALLLTINDVYRIDGVDGGSRGGLARVRALRSELERTHPAPIVLHAGDFLFPSLLSERYGGEQMVEVMNRLDGALGRFDRRLFVTFGNHEFDRKDAAGAKNLAARIEQSEFAWLGSDLLFDPAFPAASLEEAGKLREAALVNSGGVRVGLFSLTTDVTHPEYVRRFLDPETIARLLTRQLRARGADVVVALTHQSIPQDRKLLRRLGAEGPDLIVGGHEHQRHVEEVDGRWLVKADAEARSATVVRIRPGASRPEVSVSYRFLGPEEPRPDGRLTKVVEDWITRHDREYCRDLNPAREPGCLSEPVGATAVALVGEELEIRTHETNLGNWIADQAREAFDADVAFVNSGALRLNQNIPAGPITERHLRELFAYPDGELVAMTITGEILQQVINRSVEKWTGEGHFLQVSGLAFRHDPACGGATDLTLISRTSDGRVETRPVEADEPLKAVTLGYLATGGDGYRCLTEGGVPTEEARRNFLTLIADRLRTLGEIGPAMEGRICNRARADRPCLVPASSGAPPLTTVSCRRDAPAALAAGG